MRNKQLVGVLVAVLVVVPVVFVADQARRTLGTLTIVERERDTWQRPEEILRHLNPRPGDTVVDLGSGAGYFALKIAPRVGPGGRVVAVDLRGTLALGPSGAWRADIARVGRGANPLPERSTRC